MRFVLVILMAPLLGGCVMDPYWGLPPPPPPKPNHPDDVGPMPAGYRDHILDLAARAVRTTPHILKRDIDVGPPVKTRCLMTGGEVFHAWRVKLRAHDVSLNRKGRPMHTRRTDYYWYAHGKRIFNSDDPRYCYPKWVMRKYGKPRRNRP